ncbi:GtrA family protein [Xanthomonas sp. WHRI 10064A]|uniref:GtrA family protein n=1 Tax=unclassified Xanthomonas TaxID=2643310 RepID=UPI002B2394BA|nr:MULTISPECIES: GtrA family protein [unclassified Xanthomonas]MEA9586870.1 GtrA family protein [Xanthomonas sp. WHRI 10064B]MEA9616061.1 GtrA family protein [Xanthomonas sp. WHRI 10064A]
MSKQPAAKVAVPIATGRRWSAEGGGYVLASAVALLADLFVFGWFARCGWGWYGAATAGFLVGSLVAYIISVRWVFVARSFHSRLAEITTFVLIGCLGLLVVQGVMWLSIELLGMPGGIARLVAVGFSFTSNFVLRKLILFRPRTRGRVIGEG